MDHPAEMPVDQLLFNHLRAAVRNATILLVIVFGLGAVVGWAAGSWTDRPLHSGGLMAGAGLPSLWFIWAYFRTNGLMHHSGFGRGETKN